MVHAKQDELKFIEEGYGVERFDLMYNDFVIVGPKNDPANIKDENEITDVMKKLSSPSFKFISRDDNSGTHKKELSLWKMINIKTPQHASYIKTGSGMANTINIAAEMQGYVLTDRGTWIAFTNKNDLTILFEGDSALFNPYGIIAVNPNKFPHVEYEKSQQFINWLLNGKGNELIKAYAIDGQQLFFTYN
jgi:tungstate transport system substrate-binding protein